MEEPDSRIILDACYERVGDNGVGRSHAVPTTFGLGWDGRRHMLAVELAGRESASSWKEHRLRLKARGLHGVALAVGDDDARLQALAVETHEVWVDENR